MDDFSSAEVAEALHASGVGVYGAAVVLTRMHHAEHGSSGQPYNDQCHGGAQIEPPEKTSEETRSRSGPFIESPADVEMEDEIAWRRGAQERLERFKALRESVETAVAAATRTGGSGRVYGLLGIKPSNLYSKHASEESLPSLNVLHETSKECSDARNPELKLGGIEDSQVRKGGNPESLLLNRILPLPVSDQCVKLY